MLFLKITSNIFFTSGYICHPSSSPHFLQQDICCVGILQTITVSLTYYELVRAGEWPLLIFFHSRIHGLPLRYLWYKDFYPGNAHKKIKKTHKTPRRKDFGPTKYTLEKIWTHKIPTRKYFGSPKYPLENILNPQNTHDKIYWTNKIPRTVNFGPTNYLQEEFPDLWNT